MKSMKTTTLLLVSTLILGLATFAVAQPPAAPPANAAAPAPAPVPITDADLKGITTPDAKARSNGDPDGGLTGNASDITVADPITDKTPKAKGLTIGDIANQIGQNKIAINFVWTLVCGFLVMFMQAGFAIVETGLTRVKNANHTYMMNFFVYGCGLLAYWLIGFAIQMGGAAGNANLGGLNPLSAEHNISLFGKTWGLFGPAGYLLAGSRSD